MAKNTMQIGPYSYRVGPNTLGIGVDNIAFADYRIATDEPIYGPRYNVHRSFSPCDAAAQFPLAASGPHIDLKADGVYMNGSIAMQMLTQFNKSNNLS